MGKLWNNGRFVNAMLIVAYPMGLFSLWKNNWITHKFRKVVYYFYLWHCIILPFYFSIPIALGHEIAVEVRSVFIATIGTLLLISVPTFIITAIILKAKEIKNTRGEKVKIETIPIKDDLKIDDKTAAIIKTQEEKSQNWNRISQSNYANWDNLKKGDTVHSEALGVDKKSEPSLPYEKASLLTKNERNFYETIRLIAEKLNLNVLTKVRLADIVNVKKNIQSESDEWWDYFKQISQKHVDFVLADKGLSEIHLIIEVDDSSHKRADRIKRDRFVDQVLGEVGIPILHIENVIGLEEKINRLLENKNNKVEM